MSRVKGSNSPKIESKVEVTGMSQRKSPVRDGDNNKKLQG
jgi:hypothetical protein